MNSIISIATTILGNEKAMGIYEIHEQSPNNLGFHRYQIIHVIRGDRIAEFRRDMGLARNFVKVRQLRIPSYMEHTVDELIALADELRYDQEQDESTLREIMGLHQK